MTHCIKPSAARRTSNHIHARNRAAERFGLSMSDYDLDAWVEKILAGHKDTVVLRPDPNWANRELVACHVNGEWIPAVFERSTKSIVTWLPTHTIERWRSGLEKMRLEPKGGK